MSDIADIKLPTVITIFGKPNSGKSHLLKYILKVHRKEIKWGLVFTKTKFNGSFNYIVPNKYVRSQYDEKILADFLNEQARTSGVWPAIIVFDDMLDNNIFRSNLFQSLVYSFRHLNITLIITSQYAYMLNSPLIRECTVYSAVFRQRTTKSTQATYEIVGRNANDLKHWESMLDSLKGHEFLWCAADDLEEPFKVLCAPAVIGEFKMKFGDTKTKNNKEAKK